MMKHSTLIRNKGSIIYYHKGGSWNLGGEHKILGDKHKILGDKKGGTQKFFLLKEGNRRFS